jgi:diguanylate cyclase (GGDEF)-like protein
MHLLFEVFWMFAENQPPILLASNDPDLVQAIQPVVTASGSNVDVALTGEATLAALTAPRRPALALLDALLPGIDIGQLLAAARSAAGGHRYPIVLISDTVSEDWRARLSEGVLDDLIPRNITDIHWRPRLDQVLRTYHLMRELCELRERAELCSQVDPLTRVFNRGTLLSMLFRETDRAQRMNTSLSLLLLDIYDFGHWNSSLGTDACDELLCHIVERVSRILRSYDLLGRSSKDEFLVILPGCSSVDAVLLAERLRMEVFAVPFDVAGESVRLSACFGVASSEGRSPVVVLRESEVALAHAKQAGPESIRCFSNCRQASSEPIAFLSPTAGDELLAW